jgi:hypothetical protein
MTKTHQTRNRHRSWRKRDVVKWCSLSLLVLCVVAWVWSSTRLCMYYRGRYDFAFGGGEVDLEVKAFPIAESRFRSVSGLNFDLGLTPPVFRVSRCHIDVVHEDDDVDDGTLEAPRYDGFDRWTARIILPIWMITLPLTLITAWLWYRARPAIPPGHCAKCGYDLTDNVSGTCPECGMPIPRRVDNADAAISGPTEPTADG